MAARASTRGSKGAKYTADGLPDLLGALQAGDDEEAHMDQPQRVLAELPVEINSEEARQLSEVRHQKEVRLQVEENEAKRREQSEERHPSAQRQLSSYVGSQLLVAKVVC